MKKVFLLLILFSSIGIDLFSQINSDYVLKQELEVDKKYIYEFRDGTIIIGTFKKEDKGNVYIMDVNNEEIYIPRVMIAQAHEVNSDNLVGDEYWFPNLHDSRYFFAPTGFGLKEGEGYMNNIYWLVWQFQYGVTDEFSLGGGTSIFGLPTTLNAKYSFNLSKNLNMAAGYFWVGSLFWDIDDDRTAISMPFAVITRGSKENNVTLGLGYNLSNTLLDDGDRDQIYDDNGYFIGYEDPKISPLDRLTLNVGATFRASRRFSFIAEGWLFNMDSQNPTFMGGPGIRYFRKINRVTAKNGAGAKTFDFQLLMTPDMDGIIPLFGASQKF